MKRKREKSAKTKKSREKIAYVSSYADDQGGGFSLCSNCKEDITHYTREYTTRLLKRLDEYCKKLKKNPKLKYVSEEELRCPKCGYKLECGGVHIQHGGSDF